MNRRELLKELAEKINNCQKCPLYKTATQAVPGEGDAAAKIFFIGEAPGYWEDQKGRPFVGAAGKLLDQSLAVIGLKRNDVFIANILKHRPPGNRDPLTQEVEACKTWLDAQIGIIQPKIIATLGRFSMNKFIPGAFISQVHGQPRWVEFDGQRYLVFPLYHPAAALRNSKVLEEFKKDFEKLKNLEDNRKENREKVDFKKEPEKTDEQLSLL